ncbi:MAG: hypothetical protein CMK71_00905 [Pseudomonadaceae bacterium]|nr:hypothetical protein [Pseudomonadaceae bacterium]
MRKRFAIPSGIILTLVIALVVLHIALPSLVRDYLNKQMADMGDYRGHVTDVDLALWRGAYRINELKINKVNGKVPVPLLDAPAIDLSVSWSALWHEHAIVASVVFEQPRLNFVDGGNAEASQTGEGVDWREQLKALLPITLNEVRVEQGTLAFRNFTSKPNVDLEATQVNATLLNLSNTRNSKELLPASFQAAANVLGDAPLETSAKLNPLGKLDDFDLKLRITDIQLKRLNDFTRTYAEFDFVKGHGDFVMEIKARKGKLDGYAKPLLRDMEIFDWKQDVEAKDKNILTGIWEALVGSGGWLLKNHQKDQFATRIELAGDLNAYDVSQWQAFKAILRNAFVKAFSNRFDSTSE